MIYRILVFLLGLFCLTLGLSFMILYLSLFSLGFNLTMYFSYLLSNYTFYLIPAGFLLLMMSIFFDDKWRRFIEHRKSRSRS